MLRGIQPETFAVETTATITSPDKLRQHDIAARTFAAAVSAMIDSGPPPRQPWPRTEVPTRVCCVRSTMGYLSLTLVDWERYSPGRDPALDSVRLTLAGTEYTAEHQGTIFPLSPAGRTHEHGIFYGVPSDRPYSPATDPHRLFMMSKELRAKNWEDGQLVSPDGIASLNELVAMAEPLQVNAVHEAEAGSALIVFAIPESIRNRA